MNTTWTVLTRDGRRIAIHRMEPIGRRTALEIARQLLHGAQIKSIKGE